MAHTNQTTNYHLGQFVGSDKPSWLTDYNGDMLAIDTQMKANADAAAAASSAASVADGKAEAAGDDAADALSDAAVAQQTATAAATNANAALTKATTLETALNISSFSTLSWSASVGTVSTATTVSVAKNSDGSIAKIYGYLRVSNTASPGNLVLTSSDTGIRPESPITFNNCGFRQFITQVNISGSTVSVPYTSNLSYTLNTNGTITVTIPNATTYVEHDISFIACLLLVKDFGDE